MNPNPSLSPDPTWNIILMSLGLATIFFVFIIQPLAYIFIVRRFDKKYTLKNYTFEKGFWPFSPMLRLWNYIFGIVLEPYRYREIKNKLFSEFVKRLLNYQDRVYGKTIDFRADASKGQILLANLAVTGGTLLLVMLLLFTLHDFVLYPEVGRAVLRDVN